MDPASKKEVFSDTLGHGFLQTSNLQKKKEASSINIRRNDNTLTTVYPHLEYLRDPEKTFRYHVYVLPRTFVMAHPMWFFPWKPNGSALAS